MTCGKRIEDPALLTTSHFSVTRAAISIAVPHTSPSPCAKWMSPVHSGTVDQYRKHDRRTHLHCFHIHVAAILARRNRAQPFGSPGRPLSEQSCRDSPFGLRHQHEATSRGERTLAIERFGDLGLARQYAD